VKRRVKFGGDERSKEGLKVDEDEVLGEVGFEESVRCLEPVDVEVSDRVLKHEEEFCGRERRREDVSGGV